MRFSAVRWYTRELERREREWAAERALLIETICRLAGHAAVEPEDIEEPQPEDGREPEIDLTHEPLYVSANGDGLLMYEPDDEEE